MVRSLDDNPSNIMAASDGSLRITDLFYAAGPTLYGALLTDPLEVARSIPADQRRHTLQIPLASSGPWDERQRAQMQEGLTHADELLGTR